MIFYKLKIDDKYPCPWYNDKVDHFDRVICPKHPGHQRGVRNEHPLSIEIKKFKFGDFVSTVYSDWLITDRVAEIFESNHLTGYELRPVDVCNATLPFPLWEIVVTGKAEPHPDSGIKEIYRCEYCGSIKRRAFNDSTGIIIDEATWDGSDFFRIEAYPKYIFVVEKVKKIIEEYHLAGTLLIPSTELRVRSLKYDQDWTKEQWKEYFERDIAPLEEKLKRKAKETWERVGVKRDDS